MYISDEFTSDECIEMFVKSGRQGNLLPIITLYDFFEKYIQYMMENFDLRLLSDWKTFEEKMKRMNILQAYETGETKDVEISFIWKDRNEQSNNGQDN